jgi:hypothetical protein
MRGFVFSTTLIIIYFSITKQGCWIKIQLECFVCKRLNFGSSKMWMTGRNEKVSRERARIGYPGILDWNFQWAFGKNSLLSSVTFSSKLPIFHSSGFQKLQDPQWLFVLFAALNHFIRLCAQWNVESAQLKSGMIYCSSDCKIKKKISGCMTT